MGIGDRLKLAREKAGLTLQELSQRTGIGASSLCEYESGQREPKVAQLQVVAAALRRSIAFFFDSGPLTQELVLWRERPAEGVEDLEGNFRMLCEQYHYLEVWCDEKRTVDLPTRNGEPIRFGFEQAKALASEVHQVLQLGSRPALTLLTVLEENCGVKVFHLPFTPTGSAACTRSDTFGAGILLNSRNVRWRRNFDLAHELFHLLTWDIFHSAGASGAGVDDEALAGCFAGHLLMPPDEVQKSISAITQRRGLSRSDLVDLARQFDVSVDALLWHLHRIYRREVKQTQADIEQCKVIARLLEAQTSSTPPTRPARYCALAAKALRTGELSMGRFAEYMGISRHQASAYMRETPDEQEVEIASS